MAKSKTSTRSRRAARSAKLSLNRMLSDVKQPLAIVGGMVIGKFAGDLLDKGLNATSNVAGVKGLKGLRGLPAGLLKSLILIGGGLTAKQLIRNPILQDLGVYSLPDAPLASQRSRRVEWEYWGFQSGVVE